MKTSTFRRGGTLILAALLVFALLAGCAPTVKPTTAPTSTPTPTPTEKPAQSPLERYGYDPETGYWTNFNPTIIVSGSWHDMGVQFAEQAHDYVTISAAHALANALDTRDSIEQIYAEMAVYKAALLERFPDYIDFIQGLADGSGYPFEEMLLFNVMLSRAPLTPSCSHVAAWGDATEDGHVLAAINTDGAADFVMAREPNIIAYPDNANAFILAGKNCSLNEKGLAVLVSAGQNAGEGDVGIASMIAAVYLAAYCDTTAEAADTYAEHRRFSGENVHIIDASGDDCVFESTNAHYAKRVPGDFGEKSYMIANNHFLTSKMESSLYTGEDAWLDCYYRYASVEQYVLKDYGKITLNTLRRAEACTDYYDFNTGKWVREWSIPTGDWSPENRSPFFATQQRRLIDITDMVMYICEGPESDAGSFVPNILGTYCKLKFSRDAAETVTAAAAELQIQIWKAAADIDSAEGGVEERNENRYKALEKLYTGYYYYDQARLAADTAKANELFAKALSEYLEGQCYAKLAQDEPSSVG